MEPLQFTSLPSMFFANCSRDDFGGWYKRVNGDWLHYSKDFLRDSAIYAAIALDNSGLEPHENVGIIAPSSPEWIIADIATQVNHRETIPLFPNIAPENFLFQCEESRVRVLIVNAITDLDLPLQAILSKFKRVVCIDGTSPLPENGIYWNDFIEEGQRQSEDPKYFSWLDDQIQGINPDDIFSVIYTSGSTGTPKGAELSHRNMLVQIQSLLGYYHMNRKEDAALTILPVAHVLERMAVYFYTLNGLKIYFADDPKNTPQILKEVRPTIVVVVPRILERVYESITLVADRTKGPKSLFIKSAVKLAKLSDPEKRKTPLQRLYNRLVYRKMREAMGGRLKLLISGGSALNKSILRFLLNIGLPIYEGFGMTECSPVISVNSPSDSKPGTIGVPLPHLDVRIGEQNEIQVKGESVFRGYRNKPEINAQIFTEDGYYKTGDQGFFDEDGFLNFTGRIKELLKTSTGKYVSPGPIELELCRHPAVEQALVIANDRKFASAVIWLNPEGARRLLKLTKEEFDINRALQSLRVREAISRHIKRVNKKLNHWEQIRKWTLVGDELTVESGLLTPTLKIRRTIAEARYSEQIEAMYS